MTDDEWPKKIRVGGETFKVHPDMAVHDLGPVLTAFADEADTLNALLEAVGLDADTFDNGGDDE